MSKRLLTKYLSNLKKKELEEQLIDLYKRFPVVKEYYDFVFNPKEDKLLQEAKIKISNEYFPIKRKRPKARRSVAQKYIKHFIKLGVASHVIAEVMVFNLEIAQAYAANRNLQDSFFKSMANSFTEATHFIAINGMLSDFKDRILAYYTKIQDQRWTHSEEFSKALDNIA